jgi:hypothetical protein
MNTMRTILYYPAIAIPQGDWLKQTLLYWDQVASIVPARFHTEVSENGGRLLLEDPTIKYLIDENAYRTIWADRAFFRAHPEHRKMVEEFNNIVDSQEFINFLGPSNNWKLDSKIFADKILADSIEFLQERKLVRIEDDGFEYFLERKTALLYMSLLAKYLADLEVCLTIPATDVECYRDFMYFPANVSRNSNCLSLILKNMLLIPRNDVSLEDIIKFKKRRKLELLKFHEVIWQFEKELAESDNEKEAYEVCMRFSARIKIEMAELNEILDDARIATVFGTLKSLIDLKSPALWSTLGALSGKEIIDLPTSVMWAGAGVAGAVQVGAHLIDERNKKRAAMRNSAFSYLYYASKDLL